jgi:hypothetical protein
VPAEFNWWLLIVGLVIGAGAVWLILAEFSTHEDEVSEDDIARESVTIAEELHTRGEKVDRATVAAILELHHEHLRRPSIVDDEDDESRPAGSEAPASPQATAGPETPAG